jgi:ribonuclease P protein component
LASVEDTLLAARGRRTLPKQTRLARRAEYLHAYESGRKLFARFSVLFIADNEMSFSRLGITATKKAGKAHVRNRLKRWTREVWRVQREPFALDSRPADFVVNLKASAAEVSFADFKADLVALFRRAADRPR